MKKTAIIISIFNFSMVNAQQKNKDTQTEDYKLPEIPKNPKLTDSATLNSQLEFIKKDIESKIKRLQILKGSYEKVKEDAENAFKKIENEKKILQDTLQKEKTIKEERLKESVDLLSKMEPRKAADMIVPMDKDLVVQLFKRLPQRLVTKILEALPPAKATEFMEYYTRIRSGREYEILKELGLCQQSGKDDNKNENKEKSDKNVENNKK